jgi:thymidylate synthase (FAD)
MSSQELDLLTGSAPEAVDRLAIMPAGKPGQIYVCDSAGIPQPTVDHDLLDAMPVNKVLLYDGLGFIELLDMMPRRVPLGLTADLAIARAAWVSYARHVNPETGEIDPKEVDRIVRYLREHRHTSPSEMVEFTFRARVPIFVFQHIVRHRMSSMNAESGRYIEMPEEFYLPPLRMQSKDNKQGSADGVPVPSAALALWNGCRADIEEVFGKYKRLLKLGVAKEVARTILPLGLMTSFVWKMDLHNLIHFLGLRLDSHAQRETREFAAGILQLISGLVPTSMRAFEDFQLNTITLDAVEQKFIRDGAKLADRKKNQLEQKLARINVNLAK